MSWEGQSAPQVSVICWIYAWKLWVWGLVVSCVGVGSVKALRGPRDRLRRSSPSRIFYRSRPLMFRNPTLRHKTALRICLEETFPRPSCNYFRIFTVCAPCLSENCGGGGKFVLLPKTLENVAAFSEFLCPPRSLESNFPLPFLSVLPLLSPTAPLLVTF